MSQIKKEMAEVDKLFSSFHLSQEERKSRQKEDTVDEEYVCIHI